MKKVKTYSDKDLDNILSTIIFKKGGYVSHRFIADCTPDGSAKSLRHLCKKGYLEESKYGFHITTEGERFINKGGFVRKNLIERFHFYCTIIAAIGGIAAILAFLC